MPKGEAAAPTAAAGAAIAIADAIAAAQTAFAAAGLATPRLDAELLIAHARGCARSELAGRRGEPLASETRTAVAALVARRLRREPVARIIGSRDFWAHRFRLGPAVLDPRPETETLVEAALAHMADDGRAYRVLDLGTGSGALLVSLLAERPRATGVGIDIEAAAVAVAAANAAAAGVASRARFVVGDWGAALAARFDIIVCNPPYVAQPDLDGLAPEVGYDPRRALDGGRDGLDGYRQLAPATPRLLAPGGVAFFELGFGQREAAAALFAAAGGRLVGVRADLAGIERCLIVGAAAPPETRKKGLDLARSRSSFCG
jgi:release factor glutamine methyltransferase